MLHFHIKCSLFSAKLRLNLFLNKIRNFREIKNSKISRKNWHQKLQILSYQSREFHKFFWAINCCNSETHGFHKIFAKYFLISHFREILLSFCLIYFREILQKFFRNATEFFCIFSRNVSFAGKITLLPVPQLDVKRTIWEP